jgi:FAD/FMN-containing dehydrogenase
LKLISRRGFLTGAGAAVLAGCSTGRRSSAPATTTTGPSATTTRAATTTTLSSPGWQALANAMDGPLVRPQDPGYLVGLQLYDPRFDSVRPAAIAYCSSVSDVQRCLTFARTNDLPFAARSGGHSYAGYSTSPGLVIDVTRLAAVDLGPGSATIGAGARLIDVYSTLNPSGVSIPAGSCPTVGIAGLTLGGGVGVVDRTYGLTCDALTALQVVTADSRLVRADAATNTDLYWACRGGGGGNFGIAVSLTFQTFSTAPVTLAFLTWPWAAATQVLPAWFGWAPTAPDQAWSNCLLEADPTTAEPKLQVGVVWIGPGSSLNGLLDQLVAAVGSAPATRFVETVPFEHAMYVEGGCSAFSQATCHLPSQATGGRLTRQPSLAKSGYFDRTPSSAGVEQIVAGVEDRQAQRLQGAAGFDAYGGAIGRVGPAATAFVHRTALASGQFNVPFDASTSAASIAASQAWLDDWYSRLQPYTNGQAYQNYIDPHLADWADAYYGSNLSRLKQVKKAWDPDGLFRFAQSIPT